MISNIHILCAFVFYLVIICCPSSAKLCLKEPHCYCNTKKDTQIYCKNVTDLSKVENLAKRFSKIYSLRINGFEQSSIDRRIFDGQFIIVLQISGALENIKDDALVGIQGLQIVNFDGSQFSTIPKAFAKPYLRTVQIVFGQLSKIDDTLQNNTAAVDFLFNNNKLTGISLNAFRNAIYLMYLDLSYNELSHLDPAIFENFIQLKNINLMHNRLYTVNGCFLYISPQVLNLYGNDLTTVDNAFHPGMWKMKSLDLGGNPSLNLTASVFKGTMNYLLTLGLSDNQMNDFDSSLLRNFRYLHTLHLSGNNLTILPKDFLAYTPQLRTINLEDNILSSADEIFPSGHEKQVSSELGITVKSIHLGGNKLHSIRFGSSARSVTYLDISRNHIAAIRSGDFKNLIGVTSLNLSNNAMKEIETDGFKFQTKLRILDLSFNELKTLNGSIGHLVEMEHLIVDSSSLEVVEEYDLMGLNKLEKLSFSHNQLVSIKGSMRNLTSLTTLDISGNNLTILTSDTFPPEGVNKLKKLWMADNPWICDCRMIWLLDWAKKNGSKLEDNPLCQSPEHLKGKPILSLNQSELQVWVEDCPESCDCTCVPDKIDTYITIDCIGKGINKIPSVFPKNAQDIYLRNNRLKEFDGFVSNQLPKLRLLDLENNLLSKVQLKLPPSTVSLKLDVNNLQRFPFEEWNRTSLKSVSLARNPWICDCEAWAFREWLIAHSDYVKELEEIRCGGGSKLKGRVIVQLTKNDLCRKFKGNHITLLIVAVSCIILLCASCCFFRKALAALCYSCGCRCLKAKEKHAYTFDAFLLYSDGDEEFALSTIAEGLESRPPGFKLFIPTRHVFLTTSPINVESTLNECCKIIVLLSREFLLNTQCMQLLKASISCSVENSSRRLIFITREDCSLDSDIDPILKAVMASSVSLKWGQFLFWERLRYYMPKQTGQPLREDGSEPLVTNS